MRFIAPFLSLTLSILLVTGSATAQTAEILQITATEDRSAASLSVQIMDAAGAPVADAAVVFRLPDDAPAGSFSDGTHAAVAYTDAAGRATISGIKWTADPGACTIRITATRGAIHGMATIDHTTAASLLARIAAEPVSEPIQTPSTPQPIAEQPVTTQPGTPAARTLPAPDKSSSLPRVTITAPPPDEKFHSGGGKKWVILAVIAAGAGAGAAFGMKGKSSSSSSSTSTSGGITIGNPTVSVGHP